MGHLTPRTVYAARASVASIAPLSSARQIAMAVASVWRESASAPRRPTLATLVMPASSLPALMSVLARVIATTALVLARRVLVDVTALRSRATMTAVVMACA